MHRSARIYGWLALLTAGTMARAGDVTITPAALEGQAVPGVGNLVRIDNLAVNGLGQWLVEADTDFADTERDQILLRDDGLYLQEGDSLPEPPGAQLGSFDSVNLNDAGHSGWNFFLTGTAGTFDDSGIYLDTTLVVQESDTSQAVAFSPGTRYIGFFEARINLSGQILAVASVDDPLIPTTVDRALVLLDVNKGLPMETVIAKEGDILPGQTEAVEDFGTDPQESAFSDRGDVLYLADLTGLTTVDVALYLNDSLLAQEGFASPDSGRLYETIDGRAVDLNASRDVLFKANLNGATTDDDVIVKNGAIVRREGENIPAIGASIFENFGLNSFPIQIDDGGNFFYYADWNDPDTNVDTGLFRNDELIVQEGVSMVDGVVIDVIANGQDAFALSDNGRFAIFEGTLMDGRDGAFLIGIPVSAGPEGTPSPRLTWLAAAPNPFRETLGIRFGALGTTPVSLQVLDAAGRRVRRLIDEAPTAGIHTIQWDGTDATGRLLPPGVYFVRLSTAGESRAARVVRLP